MNIYVVFFYVLHVSGWTDIYGHWSLILLKEELTLDLSTRILSHFFPGPLPCSGLNCQVLFFLIVVYLVANLQY